MSSMALLRGFAESFAAQSKIDRLDQALLYFRVFVAVRLRMRIARSAGRVPLPCSDKCGRPAAFL